MQGQGQPETLTRGWLLARVSNREGLLLCLGLVEEGVRGPVCLVMVKVDAVIIQQGHLPWGGHPEGEGKDLLLYITDQGLQIAHGDLHGKEAHQKR